MCNADLRGCRCAHSSAVHGRCQHRFLEVLDLLRGSKVNIQAVFYKEYLYVIYKGGGGRGRGGGVHYFTSFNVILGGQRHTRDEIQPNTSGVSQAAHSKEFTCTFFSKVMQEPSVSDVNQPSELQEMSSKCRDTAPEVGLWANCRVMWSV